MKRLVILLFPIALYAGEQRYARLGDFEGKVEVQLTAADAWMAAQRNLPLVESTWLRTGPASRIEIELDEGSAWRLGPDSQMEISDYTRLATGQRITLLSLDKGLAYLTGMAAARDVLMLAVPGAHITVTRGARVRLEVQSQWSEIAVIEGTVRWASPAAELDLREGQAARVEPANLARFFLSREFAAMELDRWSEDRDKALANSTSGGHVTQRYGLIDLDTAGEWIETSDLGAVWKPKNVEGWQPYRNGRWRWYGRLGYTWVSDEPWGWLPYHYGRWMRKENIGWIWAPSKSAVFKPGEVYWLHGAKMAGWGLLAPNEPWPATGNAQPQQYLEATTVWAAFQQDAMAIDPRGFAAKPSEPLSLASFVVALPSPALAAAQLDAVRPLRRGVRARMAPAVEPVTVSDAPVPQPDQPVIVTPDPDAAPPPPPPDVISSPPVVIPNILIVTPPTFPDYSRRSRSRPVLTLPSSATKPPSSTNPAAAQTPPSRAGESASKTQPSEIGIPRKPEGTRVEANAPAPPNRAGESASKTQPRPDVSRPPKPADAGRSPAPAANPSRQVPASEGTNKGERPATNPRGKKFRDAAEAYIYDEVVKNLARHDYVQAMASLEKWDKRYRNSEYADDRAYCYMQAYAGLNQPEKVVERGSWLLSKDLRASFPEPMQVLGVFYLASFNLQKLTNPTKEQRVFGGRAGLGMLEYVPVCFAAENRPHTVSEADWNGARTSLETLARQTIALAGRPAQR